MIEPSQSKLSSLSTSISSLIAFVSVWVVGLILILCGPTLATADDQILLLASYSPQRDQNPPTSSNSPAVASADKVTPSTELQGVVKGISVHVTKIRIDSKGNPVGADKPDVFLVIEGKGGIETKVRWTDATTLFDTKGKRVKKVTIGKNLKEGDHVSIKTRQEKGEIQAVEVHKQ